MAVDNAHPFRIALISMPWSIFNRPSIQLGTLKSYLEREAEYRVDTYHLYLHLAKTITTELYSRIALSGWAGEALFAPLLFPEKRADAGKLFRQSLTGKGSPRPDFDALTARVEASCAQWLADINFDQYALIGFSLCFSQLFASLYLAKKIKDKWSDIPIVFGGSSCSGQIGVSLLQHFPTIDYLIDGEGEQQLLALCRFLSGRAESLPGKIRTVHPVPVAKTTIGDKADKAAAPLQLGQLPYPDYTPYFQEMRRLFPQQPFIPLLPIEFSRGCWWNKCTFCNLNLQWQNYRFKESGRMLEETLHLTEKHQSLHFTFTDNALPSKEADRFFTSLLTQDLDIDFFAEIRGITEPDRLQLYSRAGLKTVQVGIEALSTSLLAKMAKGTTTIDNIAVMKMCSATGIRMEGNLITDFPGTTAEEIAETLRNLDFVRPFLPLQAATFFLGYGSPLHTEAAGKSKTKEFPIQRITPHAKNRRLFPGDYVQSMLMLINSYQGDKKLQHRQWQLVKRKIRAWQDYHKQRTAGGQHPLHYRDGGTFLIIRQEQPADVPLLHRLRGTSRKIYLACARPEKIDTLLRAFPQVTDQGLRKFIDEMCTKRLMFQENDRVLALAVHNTSGGDCP
ncbi:RiPP maturation radical SAM C-methyltransferase [Desulfocastanea catecholica]